MRSSISAPARNAASIRRRSSSAASIVGSSPESTSSRAVEVRRDAVAAEHEHRLCSSSDSHFARSRIRASSTHDLAELGLRQHEEVLLAAAPDDDRRDDARLRSQQQRRARVADGERLDVVGHHPLQIVRRVRPRHPHIRPLPHGYVHDV
jgi:hypothetical protein